MVFPFCEGSGPLDIGNSCVQTVWSAGIPTLLATGFFFASIPISPPAYISRAWSRVNVPFQDSMTSEEAETLTLPESPSYLAPEIPTERTSPTWRTTLLIWIAFLEVFLWATRGIYEFVRREGHVRDTICFLVISTTWLYNALKPALYPKATAYIDLFILYTAHLTFGVITLASSLYHFYAYATSMHLVQWMGMTANVAVVAFGLWLISKMPLKIPPDAIKNDIVSIA